MKASVGLFGAICPFYSSKGKGFKLHSHPMWDPDKGTTIEFVSLELIGLLLFDPMWCEAALEHSMPAAI